MQTGLQLQIRFFPLSFFFFFCTPNIEINGKKTRIKWGKSFIAIPPGKHIVRVYFKYLWMSECGANQVEVALQHQQQKKISFYMPPWIFSKGRLKVTDLTSIVPMWRRSIDHQKLLSFILDSSLWRNWQRGATDRSSCSRTPKRSRSSPYHPRLAFPWQDFLW